MHTPTLLGSRSTIAVDGLRETLRLFRNSANEFEFVNTCVDAPEENFREVVTAEDASAFLMHPDTQMLCGANAAEQSADINRVFTPAQIAERWSVTADNVRGLINRGELPAFRVGPRLFRLRAEDVQEFEQRRAEAKAYAPKKRKGERSERDVMFSALQAGWKRRSH